MYVFASQGEKEECGLVSFLRTSFILDGLMESNAFQATLYND